jgi:hypothetical protein
MHPDLSGAGVLGGLLGKEIMEYNHTQLGTVIVVGLLVPTILILFLPFILGGFHSILFIPFLVLASSFPIFCSLTVKISRGILTCYFGVGLIRKDILLSDIKEYRAVHNPWFTGWGIRWMPGQYWLWNVSGYQAVELTLNNGKRFRLGSDEPEALVNALQVNKSSAA